MQLDKKFKLVGLLSLLLLFAGCSTSLKSNWKNFNAYYNTFYNAKQSYEAGEDKNLNQAREYNPLQPIRIHHRPLNAGAGDFNKAIEKGADILRKHDETKWVDDALFLIGKSYYFKQEYFSADLKFQELFLTTENEDLKQKAVYWRGRVLLDMERHTEGIAYLTDMIKELGKSWNSANLAETQAILAQHHISLENWEQAESYLSKALPDLPSKAHRERGYFLLGQVYEKLENPEAAFDAYKEVQKHYSEYRLQYLAKRKQAEVARDLGRHEVASNLFNEMIRDDKNLEYKSELDFELARTEQRRENYKKAERIYKNILRNQLNRPSPEIMARTYYGLAELYRYAYNDFAMAAAYYDSAAQRNVAASRLPADFAAEELAESFGNYARLSSEIAIQDSLLWLGQLEPSAFDSVINVIRTQKINEIKQLREAEENRQNTLVNIDPDAENTNEVTDLRNGFLNSDNPVLQQDARIQFLAVWGDRPLADYWRVRSLIRTPQVDDELNDAQMGAVTTEDEVIFVDLELERIPFTPQQQDSVRKQIAAYQYQLGNLFFLSLNMPDSAAYYFKRAVENPSDPNVTLVSLYSLAELYAITGEMKRSREYAAKLIDEFPGSEYAERLAETYDFELEMDSTLEVDTLQLYKSISETDSLEKFAKAELYKNFAREFPSHRLASEAQWQTIQLYISEGKQQPDYTGRFKKRMEKQQQWEQKAAVFKQKQDSARIMIKDTSLTVEQRSMYNALVDSTLSEPDLSTLFPYSGQYWDSARTAIEVYLDKFPKTEYFNRVKILQAELALPISQQDENQEEPYDPKEKVESAGTTKGYRDCSEIDATLIIRGGQEAFISKIQLPEDHKVNEIKYIFMINQRGIIDEYHLVSENVHSEFVESFESGFSSLSFEPVLYNGEAVPVQCQYTFSLGK